MGIQGIRGQFSPPNFVRNTHVTRERPTIGGKKLDSLLSNVSKLKNALSNLGDGNGRKHDRQLKRLTNAFSKLTSDLNN
jgi:hypothetical protein